ncbi:hypothetical protein [Priestia filamentosa]|uniref:hypothetical protein n=1 Tax=Priestia filamentosa TaxID=1402861 RepID=UPI00398229E7
MNEELKREHKQIKRFVFKSLVKEKPIELFLIILFIWFLDETFNAGIITFVWHHKSYWEFFILGIYVYLLIAYKNKFEFHKRRFNIDYIKVYYKNPKATLEVYLDRRQTSLDIIKNNTDILKVFSPIPIVVFLLGLFFQDKLTLNSSLSKGIVISICYYVIKMYRLAKQFKECRISIDEYKHAIHHIENPDLNIKKPRDSLYTN